MTDKTCAHCGKPLVKKRTDGEKAFRGRKFCDLACRSGHQRELRSDINSEVVRLRGEGLTYSAIAARCGITKNAAIGIGHRAGIGETRPVPPKPIVPDIFPPHGCLFGLGDPKDEGFRFCSAPVERAGEAWCAEHRKRVYTRPLTSTAPTR